MEDGFDLDEELHGDGPLADPLQDQEDDNPGDDSQQQEEDEVCLSNTAHLYELFLH